MLEIVKPCREYLESYYEACVVTKGHVHEDYIMHNPDKYDEWKDTIFQNYEKNEKGIDLPDGFVPSATRWVVEDGKYIGTVNIRKKVNDSLMNWGGTIGIIIRYDMRGQGYSIKATEAYRKNKELYDYIEDDFFVYTIEKSNEFSLKMYYKCNYINVKKDCYTINVNGKDIEICRFIIDKKEVFRQ